MAEEVALSVLKKFAGLIVDPIVCHFCYLFQYKRNIDNLKDELTGLQASRDGIQIQVQVAEYNLEIVDPAMRSWVNRVNEIETRAITLIQKTSNADNMTCLNCLELHYLLSKNATKLTRSILKLKLEGEKYVMSTHSAPPPGIMTTVDALLPQLTTRIDATPTIQSCEQDIESRKSVFKRVIYALEDDKIQMIGISGTGGVGKTTFVNEVCQKARAMGLFDQFAMTAVSQKHDLLKIQDELAEMLGLKFTEEKTVLARAHRLRSRLTNGRKILVILDDVWQEISLKQLGIPMVGDRGGCKVLFTSRDKHVFTDMGTQLNLTVEALTYRESWDLFAKNIGGDINRKHFAIQIVDDCKGIPFAIVTLAKAMRKEEAPTWDCLKVSPSNCPQNVEEKKLEGTKRKLTQECDVLENEKKRRHVEIIDCRKPLSACVHPSVKKQHRSKRFRCLSRRRSFLPFFLLVPFVDFCSKACIDAAFCRYSSSVYKCRPKTYVKSLFKFMKI